VGEVLEGHQGGRVVLAQRAAQGVGVPSACPDQVLVGAGENSCLAPNLLEVLP
jgi:hypothetical protein